MSSWDECHSTPSLLSSIHFYYPYSESTRLKVILFSTCLSCCSFLACIRDWYEKGISARKIDRGIYIYIPKRPFFQRERQRIMICAPLSLYFQPLPPLSLKGSRIFLWNLVRVQHPEKGNIQYQDTSTDIKKQRVLVWLLLRFCAEPFRRSLCLKKVNAVSRLLTDFLFIYRKYLYSNPVSWNIH